jgi:hypothetical protein
MNPAVSLFDVLGLPKPGEKLRAVKICSHVLDACIWLALDESFQAEDGLAVFYASEIPLLRHKSEETLRKIHEVRLVFNGGKVIAPEVMQ